MTPALPLRPTAEPVWDVLIVGAGLCGLALARQLLAQGLRVQVLEARDRPGGRAYTRPCPQTGLPLDLGPAWFWPASEPLLQTLVSELGLPTLAQHDDGELLSLTEPDRGPQAQTLAPGQLHQGAQRLQGGMGRLVQALAERLPPGVLHLQTPVRRIVDHGDHIAVWPQVSRHGGPPWRARQVVLALPPRLVDEHLRLEPPLPEAVQTALQATPTWMATQAKALVTHPSPYWHARGHSGNAYVRHEQAVLAEVFDQSAPHPTAGVEATDIGALGALGGFVALDAEQRLRFAVSLPLLIDSQLTQLFGPAPQDGHLTLQDWANETWTCASADLAAPAQQMAAGHALLRQPLWQQRLHLGGSETARHGACHLEGALDSAAHLAQQVLAQTATLRQSATPAASTAAPAVPGSHAAALAQHHLGVQALRQAAPALYRQQLARLLASPNQELLTQRALLAAAEQTYSRALAELEPCLGALDIRLAPPPDTQSPAARGRHPLTPLLLAPFQGWNQALLQAALTHNRSACALSNFPAEAQPNAALLRAITLDLAAAWREFAQEVNARLTLRQPWLVRVA